MSCPSDSVHSLLEPPSPAYSNVTVRRAFIVWLYCGQTNKFRHVCNYYHYLESLEDKLSVENRAISRRHEFDLFTNPPPTSAYLRDHHPKLYTDTQLEKYYVKKLESIRNEKCVFKLEGFQDIAPKNGPTKREIVDTSQLIRKYCICRSISLKKFLCEFKEYARICVLTNTVQNVAFYIKRQMIKEEVVMIASCPRTFSFLEDDDVETECTNFIVGQSKLLKGVQLLLSPKVCNDDPWRVESQTKMTVAKKTSQNDDAKKATIEAYTNVIMQKFKNELTVK